MTGLSRPGVDTAMARIGVSFLEKSTLSTDMIREIVVQVNTAVTPKQAKSMP